MVRVVVAVTRYELGSYRQSPPPPVFVAAAFLNCIAIALLSLISTPCISYYFSLYLPISLVGIPNVRWYGIEGDYSTLLVLLFHLI